MTSSAKYPEGFQLGKCQSLHEEIKGTASFRMYPDLTRKKIHIEVWTPDMARRKQKCVAKGTELSTVAYYYGIFVDYSPQNSTKAQMIYLSATPIVINGEYNENIGVASFDSKVKAEFDYAVYKMEFHEAITGISEIRNPTRLVSFPKGGIVKESEHTTDEFILPPTSIGAHVRSFQLMGDGKLQIIPSDGDKIDFVDNLHNCNFFKTPEIPFEEKTPTYEQLKEVLEKAQSSKNVSSFNFPEVNYEALAPTETPIQTIRRLMLENKQIKKLILQAVNDLDSEKYKECLLRYEANERYIKTATEELKRIF